MATAKTQPVDFIAEALLAEVQKRVKQELEKELERAMVAVEAALKRQVDSMALNIMSMYDMQQMNDRIVITVRKLETEDGTQ